MAYLPSDNYCTPSELAAKIRKAKEVWADVQMTDDDTFSIKVVKSDILLTLKDADNSRTFRFRWVNDKVDGILIVG